MSNPQERLFDDNGHHGANDRSHNKWQLVEQLGSKALSPETLNPQTLSPQTLSPRAWNHERLGFTPFATPRRSSIQQSFRDSRPSLLLNQVIQQDVIPRLAQAARSAFAGSASAGSGSLGRPGTTEILQLTDLVLANDAAAIADRIAGMALDGMPAEVIFVDLLTPVARRLGELWETDLCDFTQVTIGIMRLQRAMRELTPAFHDVVQTEPRYGQAGYHALLLPTPGEQHSFGLVMVAEYFRRAGWSVSGGAALSLTQLSKLVRSTHYAVVGLSVGSERRLDILAACIRQIRLTSRNRAIGVLVGGPLFIEQPDLVARVGADATAVDGRDAVRQAKRLAACGT